MTSVTHEELVAGSWVSPTDRLRNGYYGLHQRAFSEMDAGAAGYTSSGMPSMALDRREHFYYDASWRLLERRADEAYAPGQSFDHDETAQWLWGQRYIDELLAYQMDGEGSTEAAAGAFGPGDVRLAATDRTFSVIAVTDRNGERPERVRYTPYGEAQASPYADGSGDGAVNGAETLAIISNWGRSYPSYPVEMDFDLNGAIDGGDHFAALNNFGTTIPRGDLSSQSTRNIVGYAGYLFEPATGLYCVRFRWYLPEHGRWTKRDPLGYVDGQNGYEYVGSSGLRFSDPSGLRRQDCWSDLSEEERAGAIIDKYGSRTSIFLGMGIFQKEGQLLWNIFDNLEYAECIAKCVKENPAVLVLAAEAFAIEFGKYLLDAVSDNLFMDMLLHIQIERSANGDIKVGYDFYGLGGDATMAFQDVIESGANARCQSMHEALESIEGAIEEWRRNGAGTPGDYQELMRKHREKYKEFERDMKRARDLQKRGKLAKELAKATKFAARMNAYMQAAQIAADYLQFLADECDYKCKRREPDDDC